MIVILRIDIDDDRRRALRHSWGKNGLATRDEIRNEVAGIIEAIFDDKFIDMEMEMAEEILARTDAQ